MLDACAYLSAARVVFDCRVRSRARKSHDIQFASFCAAHFVVTFLTLLQKSTALRPVMSPWPNFESLVPPNENGSRGTGTPMFTPSMPLVLRSATRRATEPVCVKIDVALP